MIAFILKKSGNILEDKRFAELFTDPNFQINPDSEEFKLLNPVVQKVNEKKLKKKAVKIVIIYLFLIHI